MHFKSRKDCLILIKSLKKHKRQVFKPSLHDVLYVDGQNRVKPEKNKNGSTYRIPKEWRSATPLWLSVTVIQETH